MKLIQKACPLTEVLREGALFTKSIEELIPWLYLKGVSTNGFPEALQAPLGLMHLVSVRLSLA